MTSLNYPIVLLRKPIIIDVCKDRPFVIHTTVIHKLFFCLKLYLNKTIVGKAQTSFLLEYLVSRKKILFIELTVEYNINVKKK